MPSTGIADRIRETLNAVEAWLSSLPGQVYANVRQPPISTLNLAHMMPFSAVWAGPERDEHLRSSPLLYGKAEGSTPFRFSLHVGDVGHTLVVGPTGSGKSTTLYSMLNELDREQRNVISLEDPVEYNIPGVNQSQVRPEIGYTFANGLRSILRQDPDIIMVGEIRDKETAQLAVQAALTGHLVFSTLHTNSAAGVIPRLIDMEVDPYLIAPTLILAMGQRLLRTMCAGSEKSVPLSESMRTMIDKQLADLPPAARAMIKVPDHVYDAIPTASCPSGTRGRTGVFEMLKIDRDIEHVILTNPSEQAVYDAARAKGMLTMKDDALVKAFNGVIPFGEVNNII